MASCLRQSMVLGSRSIQDRLNFMTQAKSEVPLTGLNWCVDVEKRPFSVPHSCWRLCMGIDIIWSHSHVILTLPSYVVRLKRHPAIGWFYVAQAKSEATLKGLDCCVKEKAMPHIATHSCWRLDWDMKMIWQHSRSILSPSSYVIMLQKQHPVICWIFVAQAKIWRGHSCKLGLMCGGRTNADHFKQELLKLFRVMAMIWQHSHGIKNPSAHNGLSRLQKHPGIRYNFVAQAKSEPLLWAWNSVLWWWKQGHAL